eukprot:CAMPEP_0119393570 /NCGR_PEP_ID=MMETSP1334-20130426/125801_1 /TAXON_ID=127549 /ORGANISM="Calcidiscus leptoporus, Strain RCC1130" /LENGTH=38 /DNA_ID= /DNA_START= /DNA_END= /DNA_ORIENTATION=
MRSWEASPLPDDLAPPRTQRDADETPMVCAAAALLLPR